jgi:hypothetical protein
MGIELLSQERLTAGQKLQLAIRNKVEYAWNYSSLFVGKCPLENRQYFNGDKAFRREG